MKNLRDAIINDVKHELDTSKHENNLGEIEGSISNFRTETRLITMMSQPNWSKGVLLLLLSLSSSSS